MIRSDLAFIGATVALVVVLAAIGWMLRAYLPGATVADIFLFWMSPVLKLLVAAIVVLSGVGAIAGLKRNAARVRMAAITAVTVGVLGAAYGNWIHISDGCTTAR